VSTGPPCDRPPAAPGSGPWDAWPLRLPDRSMSWLQFPRWPGITNPMHTPRWLLSPVWIFLKGAAQNPTTNSFDGQLWFFKRPRGRGQHPEAFRNRHGQYKCCRWRGELYVFPAWQPIRVPPLPWATASAGPPGPSTCGRATAGAACWAGHRPLLQISPLQLGGTARGVCLRVHRVSRAGPALYGRRVN